MLHLFFFLNALSAMLVVSTERGERDDATNVAINESYLSTDDPLDVCYALCYSL